MAKNNMRWISGIAPEFKSISIYKSCGNIESSGATAAYKEGSKPWGFLEEFEVSLRYVSILGLGLGLNLGLLWNCTTNWQETKDEVWLCISSRNPSSPLKESWASKIHYLVMPHEIIRLHHFRCIFSFYTLST